MTIDEMLFIAEREAKARMLFAQAIAINNLSSYYEVDISYYGKDGWMDIHVYSRADDTCEPLFSSEFKINSIHEQTEADIDDAFKKLLQNQSL